MNARFLSRRRPGTHRGFTLIEVLAAITLIAIVMPSIMRGISMAQAAGDTARHRTEASGLAQMELNQIIAAGTWSNGNQSGDFSPDWPDYAWSSAVADWPGDTAGAGLQEIDLTVSWQGSGGRQSVTLSTLVYPRTSTTSTTAL